MAADTQPSIVADVAQGASPAGSAIATTATATTVTTNGNGIKKKMSGVFGFVVGATTVGYISLVFHSVHVSNAYAAGGLIMGFALFAQKMADNFTTWMES